MIREATASDQSAIRGLYLAAFQASEREEVAALAQTLLADATSHLHLLAEEDQTAIGHVSFSPVYSQSTGDLLGSLLAPLGVIPNHQGRGVGSALVREGLKRLPRLGIRRAFVYGDPDYYGRFGFTAQAALPFTPPFPLSYPEGWLALTLTDEENQPAPTAFKCAPAFQNPDLW